MEPGGKCMSVLSAPPVFPFSNHYFLWQKLHLSLFCSEVEWGLSGCRCSEIRPRVFCRSRVHRLHSSFTNKPYLNILKQVWYILPAPDRLLELSRLIENSCAMKYLWRALHESPPPFGPLLYWLWFKHDNLACRHASEKILEGLFSVSEGLLPQKPKASLSLSSSPQTLMCKTDKGENKKESEKQMYFASGDTEMLI